jgi:hypothetical protein
MRSSVTGYAIVDAARELLSCEAMYSERPTRPSLRVPHAGSADRIAERIHNPRFSPGALEAKLLAALDGVRTVGLVARRVGLSSNEALSLLEKLERMGAVRFVDVVSRGDEEIEIEEAARITLTDDSFDRPTMPNA